MIDQDQFFKDLRWLFKQDQADQALSKLRDSLQRDELDVEGIDRAGRLLRSRWSKVASETSKNEAVPLRVLLLGQFTTSWLVPALTAVAWGKGQKVLVSEGGYDNVLQNLAAEPTGEGAPDLVVLLPWNQRLLGGEGSPEERVELEMDFWRQAWSMVSGRLASRLLQVGYDWVVPGAQGHQLSGRPDEAVGLIRAMNESLRRDLPRAGFFLDLEQVSGMIGRASFYDMRRYYWTKQPFGESGCIHLARHLFAGVRALTTGPKKVLVLDLDNTLWGGVVGETGPPGVALGESTEGEAFRAFQKHVKELASIGVVLALASKNNLRDALEPFEKNQDMVLSLNDIAAYEINWEPKGTTIARLAATLNLGLDSFVFFDDNPAEREQVRQALPDVEVVDVPEDPAEYVRTLQAGLWFETTGLTEADSMRAAQYAVERRRRELEQTSASLDDYLRSLEMVAEVRSIDESDLQRVIQLLAKTNQFNLTTRRHTQEDVLEMLSRPGSVGKTFRVRDRFGDHGLVAVLIGVPEVEGTLRVDTWLMSCRVIGRTVEKFCFRTLVDCAREAGHQRIVGEFVPSAKNALVADLYDELGFARMQINGHMHSVFYEFELSCGKLPVTFIALEGGA